MSELLTYAACLTKRRWYNLDANRSVKTQNIGTACKPQSNYYWPIVFQYVTLFVRELYRAVRHMILPPILPVAAVCRSDESHVLRVIPIFMNARSERLRLPIGPLERPTQVAVLRGNAATALSSLQQKEGSTTAIALT